MDDIVLREINSTKESTHFYNVLDDLNVVGKAQLRIISSKSDQLPVGFESNIYYEVEEQYRRKGYGKKTLALLIEKAKEFGLKNLIVTTAEDNIGSIKIIEKSGFIFAEKQKGSDNVTYFKYTAKV